eukprot:CAMPEP_0174259076 /NCGR_PEP_ID=MMETSP0439-20130205/7958_1 /TAXON_ID=0 /ORGANISM="Stereomyxa ramosa, Strain Chinc5" /LENGTH=213 /DNA_ID=CAMNT_0015342825 /DNA_START=44 /DNA_END=685 /DNA_ORIENTATION=+
MGISRDSKHKRRKTGGKRTTHRKKRKYEMGRPPSMTKLVPGQTRIHPVRVRGGRIKYRALRLESGNFSWGSESITRKTRLLAVVYNASNNELVRTNTLVKNAIVQIDASPFKQWYEKHYGVKLSTKASRKAEEEKAEQKEETKLSKRVKYKLSKRRRTQVPLEPAIEEQFTAGRVLACISSRPGQCGRCDGYLLEADELAFYSKKMQKKKGKS